LKYLLDTNVCVALINGKSQRVEANVLREIKGGSELIVSSVTVFELWYGVEKSQRKTENAQRLVSFLAQYVSVISFDDEDARFGGRIRAELESTGRPISHYDLLIAGQALRHKMTLVTANVREFNRVNSLAWEDWSKA
jgi:tRNA(fMet)-specific endonuclease VapC